MDYSPRSPTWRRQRRVPPEGIPPPRSPLPMDNFSSRMASQKSLPGTVPKASRKWVQYLRNHEELPLPIGVGGGGAGAGAAGRGAKGAKEDADLIVPPATRVVVPDWESVAAPRTGKPTCYFLHIHRLTGLRIPAEVDRAVPRSNLQFRYYVSLFHEASKQFFGRTWISDPHRLRDVASADDRKGGATRGIAREDAASAVAMPAQTLYFRSSVNDETCYAVVELVLERISNSLVVAQYGVGWTTLNIFSKGRALDDAAQVQLQLDNDDAPEQGAGPRSPRSAELAAQQRAKATQRPLFAGTPRALLVVDPDTDWRAEMKPAGGLKLLYDLYRHSTIADVAHLFRENELLGPRDVIGGLPTEGRCLPAQPSSPLFATLSRERLPTFSMRIANPSVSLPPGFEKKLLANLSYLQSTRWLALGKKEELSGRVTARRLRIGVHNGRTFVHEPTIINLEAVEADVPMDHEEQLRRDTLSHRFRLEFQGEFSVRSCRCEVRDDPALAVVFELEYVIEWHKRGDHMPPVTTPVAVGFTARVISNRDLAFDGSPSLVTLQRGPGVNTQNQLLYGEDRLLEELPAGEMAEDPSLLFPQAEDMVLEVSLHAPALAGAGAPRGVGLGDDDEYEATEEAPRVQSRGARGRGGLGRLAITPQPHEADIRVDPRSPRGGRGRDLVDDDEDEAAANEEYFDEHAEGAGADAGAMYPRKGGVRRLPPGPPSALAAAAAARAGLDLGLELADVGVVDAEFSFRFCSFRPDAVTMRARARLPRALVFSYKFFTRPATVTERVELQEGGGGQAPLSPSGRRSPPARPQSPRAGEPVSYRFSTENVFQVSTPERVSLAEYLFSRELLVHVWDAASLLYVGSAWVPLFRILRQGEREAACELELDVRRGVPGVGSVVVGDADPTDPSAQAPSNGERVGTIRLEVRHRALPSPPVPGRSGAAGDALLTRLIPASVGESVALAAASAATSLPARASTTPARHGSGRGVAPVTPKSASAGAVGHRGSGVLSPVQVPLNESSAQARKVCARPFDEAVRGADAEARDFEGEDEDGARPHRSRTRSPPKAKSPGRSSPTRLEGPGRSASRGSRRGREDEEDQDEEEYDEGAYRHARAKSKEGRARSGRRRGDEHQDQDGHDDEEEEDGDEREHGRKYDEDDDDDENPRGRRRGRQGRSERDGRGRDNDSEDEELFTAPIARTKATRSHARSFVEAAARAASPKTPKRAISEARRRQIASTPIPRVERLDEAERVKRERDLQRVIAERELAKSRLLERIVTESTTQSRVLAPAFGQLVFFEVAFRNPFPEPAEFTISINDPAVDGEKKKNREERQRPYPRELHLVSDAQEWAFLRREYGIDDGGVQEDLFGKAKNVVCVDGLETVSIPFKFQSFLSGAPESGERGHLTAAFPRVAGAPVGPTPRPISARTINVHWRRSGGDGSLIAVLRVDVRPQQFVVDSSLHLHHFGGERMQYALPLPAPRDSLLTSQARLPLQRRGSLDDESAVVHQSNLHIGQSRRVCQVVSSLEDISLELRDPATQRHTVSARGSRAELTHASGRRGMASVDELGAVVLSCQAPAFPEVRRFFLLMYTDDYLCHLHSVVEVLLHSHQRAEMAGVSGGEARGKLVLPVVNRSRRVECFAWPPELVSFGPRGRVGESSEPVAMAPNAVNQVLFAVAPTQVGPDHALIHVVDAEAQQLLHSWLLSLHSQEPAEGEVADYDVQLRVGAESKKSMSYFNRHERRVLFTVESSDPRRLKVLTDRLDLAAGATRDLKLVFLPVSGQGADTLSVFVRDERGTLDQVIRFHATWRS